MRLSRNRSVLRDCFGGEQIVYTYILNKQNGKNEFFTNS